MRKLLRAIAVGILPLSVLMPSAYSADNNGEINSVASQADAAWEGLSSEDQSIIRMSGLSGEMLDLYVIDYRNTQLRQASETCMEDQPCWDCATMGNKVCGPVRLSELPRTN